MLGDLQSKSLSLGPSTDLQSIEDWRKLVGELNIDDSTDNGDNLPLAHLRGKCTDSISVVASNSATLSEESR